MGASAAVLASLFVPGLARAETAGGDTAALDEVVVTARRQSESLQYVPQSVVPVTGEVVQRLQLKSMTDIQRVVPGLRLSPPDRGSGGIYSLRGSTFDVQSGQFSSIAFYVNDAAMQASHLFDGGALYDMSQIEVLRGPQGTNRGISAPSGAITMTTNKPILDAYGGYVDGGFTDMHGRSLQGAANLPIVKDVLGVRIAGVFNNSQGNFARGIDEGSPRPRIKTYAGRINVRYAPSDLLEADIMYDHRETDSTQYEQVAGSGRAGGFVPSPPLTPKQRASAQDFPYDGHAQVEMVTARIRSHFAGHTLEYVGGYGYRQSKQRGPGDIGGVVPGGTLAFYSNPKVRTTQTTHELRLSSDEGGDRFLDYTVGVFYQWWSTKGHSVTSRTALPGAFGPPGSAPNLASPNGRYILDVQANFDQFNQEFSGFASATAHLGAKTDLTGGVRAMRSIFKAETTITGSAFAAAALPANLCAGRGVASPVYTGACDIPTRISIPPGNFRQAESPVIYNLSLSHRFTPDFMVYATTGTSFRPANASVGVRGNFATSTDPTLRGLVFHPSEKSTNYEGGFKATLLDGRARLNASVYQQKFKGFQVYSRGIRFLDITTAPAAASQANFSVSTDVRVRGVDAEAALKITPEWDAAVQFSYASDKVTGAGLTCNIFAANGQPVFNTGGVISFCDGLHASREAPWNMTFTSNYERMVSDDVEVFVRGLLVYTAKNNRQPEVAVDSYATLNLYVGARDREGTWEASLYARNLFNTFRVLGREADLLPNGVGSFPQLNVPVGYYLLRATPPREFGLNVRYAFGSR